MENSEDNPVLELLDVKFFWRVCLPSYPSRGAPLISSLPLVILYVKSCQ